MDISRRTRNELCAIIFVVDPRSFCNDLYRQLVMMYRELLLQRSDFRLYFFYVGVDDDYLKSFSESDSLFYEFHGFKEFEDTEEFREFREFRENVLNSIQTGYISDIHKLRDTLREYINCLAPLRNYDSIMKGRRLTQNIIFAGLKYIYYILPMALLLLESEPSLRNAIPSSLRSAATGMFGAMALTLPLYIFFHRNALSTRWVAPKLGVGMSICGICGSIALTVRDSLPVTWALWGFCFFMLLDGFRRNQERPRFFEDFYGKNNHGLFHRLLKPENQGLSLTGTGRYVLDPTSSYGGCRLFPLFLL